MEELSNKDKKLYLDYFEDSLRLSPSSNDYLNYSKMNYLRKYFENFLSPAHIKKQKAFYKKYDRLLKKKNAGIKPADYSLFDKVLKYEIDTSLESFKYPLQYMPLNQMDNIITQYMEMASGAGLIIFERPEDYRIFLEKTKQFAVLCAQMITNIRIGMRRKYVLPRVIAEMTISELEGAISYKTWTNPKVPPAMKKQWDAIMEKYLVGPTLAIIHFMKTEYLPSTTEKIGYSALPNGRNLYKFIVKSYTTIDTMTIADIHNTGRREVRRIFEEMKKVKTQSGFKGSIAEFNNHLKTAAKYHFDNEADLMHAYLDEEKAIWKTIVPKYFDIFPSYTYSIKKVPAFMEESAPAAYYWSGDFENKRKGTFYINLRDVKSMAKMDVEVLSLHEGNPGHHFQQTIQMESKNIPLFIKSANYVSYVEGWGLYSENLGEYRDILSYYGKLNFEMMRAVRLVVDTGIHYYGWTFKRCKDYFLKYTSLPISEIDAEIYRYIADPAQALAYKIGELTIMELREKYLARGGDIKTFHRLVLENGNLPLKVLREYVMENISK